MKLDAKHTAMRTNSIMMTPLPSISTTQDEKEREITYISSTPAMAFTTPEDKRNEPLYMNKGRTYSGSSPSLGSGKKLNSFYCNHCKMFGHFIERCWNSWLSSKIK